MGLLSDQSNLLNMQFTILGAMMKDPDCIGVALEQLRSEDFTTLGTRALFNAIHALHSSGAPIEPAAIRQQLGEEYDEVLRTAWKHDTSDVQWYINALQQYGRIAAIQASAYQIVDTDDPEEIQQRIDALNAVSSRRQKTRIFSASDMAELMMEQLDKNANTTFYRSGLRGLDEEVEVEPGHFVILGGYPSAGKTALSLQMALYMARDYRVGYFSLETDERRAARRFLASMASLPTVDIRKKTFTDEQITDAANAASRFSELHIDFIPDAGVQVRDIRSMALARRYQVIFIDYLQIIPETGNNRFEVVTNISQALHRMAQETRIAVFALAQLTRSTDKTGKPQPPTMHSLRESGQLEQDADIIMLLYQTDPDDYTSPRFLKVAKNKDGPKVKLTLDFDGKCQQFSIAREKSYGAYARRPTRPRKQSDQLTFGQYELMEEPTEEIPF